MKLAEQEFKKELEAKARTSGIELTQSMIQRLYDYKEMLIEWNEKINLTAIIDDQEIIAKHFVDSMYCIKHIEGGESVIDVGTGAGLPGIVIAIYFEGKVDVTLFDALNKRLIFLDEVIKKLNLKNVQTLHGRAEEISQEAKYREAYDVVVSRAVSKLNVLLEISSALVKVNGKAIYMKSEKANEELETSVNAAKKLNMKQTEKKEYAIEGINEVLNHNLLIYKKEDTTPKTYPRQYSKIKKNPL